MKFVLVPGTYYWNYDFVGFMKKNGFNESDRTEGPNAGKKDYEVIIDEHPELFVSHKYHKSAIIYRRLCGIKLYEHFQGLGISVRHIKFGDHEHFMNSLRKTAADVFFPDPSNDRIYSEFISNGFRMLPGMSFYFQPEFFDTKHFWTDRALYSYVCKETGFKFAGKSYDTLNRNKLPKDTKYSDQFPVKPYTEKFADIERLNLWGSGNIYFPVVRKDALRALDKFLSDDLHNFGPYQDAMDFAEDRGNIIYHSGISSMLNIGLIVPADILPKILPLKTKEIEQSVEAFFRQIFGWREYMRQIWLLGVYINDPSKHTKKYICSWPEFMTGHYSKYYLLRKHKQVSLRSSKNDIIKAVMKRIEETGYCHHIERLMILGNYLFMSKCDPVSAVEQFLGLTVDAYPWVMYGNVVYMSQFTFGRVYTSRPYFSSGNYIRKMSINSDSFKKAIEEYDKLYHEIIKESKLPKMWH